MQNLKNAKVSDEKAKESIKTLLKWIGENPDRNGLIETPQRVINSFKEYFSGYTKDPAQILQKTFTETSGYQDIVLLKNIKFYSFCEHHIAPIDGVVHIAYYPDTKVVGISKLARIVEIYSKRLQIQERMTAEIANIINLTLKPKGVAVMVEANHNCVNNRGVNQKGIIMKTTTFIGCFKNNTDINRKFFELLSH